MIPAAIFLDEALSFFVYEHGLDDAGYAAGRILGKAAVHQVAQEEKLNLVHIAGGSTDFSSHGDAITLRAAKAVGGGNGRERKKEIEMGFYFSLEKL